MYHRFRDQASVVGILCAILLCMPVTVLAQEVCPDGFEYFGGDDEMEGASLIPVSILGAMAYQDHTLHTGPDSDWVMFAGVQNAPYEIYTTDVGLDLFMYMELYDEQENLLDCYDDDLDPRARFNYSMGDGFPYETGLYYVRLVNRWCTDPYPPTSGCGEPVVMDPACTLYGSDAGYRFAVLDNSGETNVQVRVLSLTTEAPIEGADVWVTIDGTGLRFDGPKTDAGGWSAVTVLTSGACKVAADRNGFVRDTEDASCVGASPYVSMKLEPGTDPCGTLPLKDPPVGSVSLYCFVLLLPAVFIGLTRNAFRK